MPEPFRLDSLSKYGWRITRVESLRFCGQVGDALHQAKTAVPAKQGVVVGLRPDLFRFLKVAQRVFKACSQRVRVMAGAKLRLGPTLIHDPQIVGTLVSIRELLKAGMHFVKAVGDPAGELVSDCQSKLPQRHLVFWIDGENVAAD